MRIIKFGKILGTIKIFECKNCGCVFEATNEEYNYTSELDVICDGLPPYNIMCPCCQKYCYAE